MKRTDDKAVLAEAKPFVRSIVALIIFTFRRTDAPSSIGVAYQDADAFIVQLERDLSK